MVTNKRAGVISPSDFERNTMRYVLERDTTSLKRCMMLGWKLVGCNLACGVVYFATTNEENLPLAAHMRVKRRENETCKLRLPASTSIDERL